jgi:hypothetical protein
MPSERLDLSVVVAAIDPNPTLEACLDAMCVAVSGLSAEILIVGMVGTRFPRRPGLRAIDAPADAVTPDLWALGIAQARGPVVALTTGHVIVGPGWARALIGALGAPAGAAGGSLGIGPGTSLVDWAIYYLRYTPFLAETWPDGAVAGEIAGDNAAYCKTDLDRHASMFAHGFWEVDFHRVLRGDGRTIVATRGAHADLGPGFRARSFCRHRFRHGVTFGRARVGRGESRARLVLGAPLVPLVLAARIGRRIAPYRAHLARFAASLPILLLFASSWAAGEAMGALSRDEPVTGHPRARAT